MPPYKPAKIRFEEKIRNRSEGCWLWDGSKNHKGYGTFSMGKDGMDRTVLAHRFAWESENGPIPDGMCVLHRCDNPSCVRPDHLFIGTDADNAVDRDSKGRGGGKKRRGVSNGRTHLTDDDVAAIRRRFRSGEFQRVIAASFGVAQTTISRIVREEVWNHVKERVE